MTYAFIQNVPADETMYAQIKAKLGDEPPKGLIAHVVMKQEAGLRYLDVWETEADWDTYREAQVEPAVGEVLASYGLPHDHSLVSFEDVDVIDTWLGARARVG